MNKLIPKSRYVDKSKEAKDSVKARLKRLGTKQNLELLITCQQLWDNLDDVRKERLRNFRYVFGDQWGDLVWDGSRYVTERSRIKKRTGGLALQNNHLFKVVNAISGIYSKSETMPVCFARTEDASSKSQMMTDALQTNYEINEEREIMMSEIVEMICGGLPVVCEEWSSHDGHDDAYTYAVDPSYFFFRSKGSDPRMWDIDIVGEIRDYTLNDLAAEIASSGFDYSQLKQLYSNKDLPTGYSVKTSQQHEVVSWGIPPSDNLCRVYRIWTLERKERVRCYDPMDMENPLYKIDVEDLPLVIAENEKRMADMVAQGYDVSETPVIEYGQNQDEDVDPNSRLGHYYDEYWHFQMLNPDGLILTEYDSPYEHKSHPYTFVPHHYVNGHIYPFISVVIDQQRYINRLISLHDLAIQNSAKGIKMIPTSVLGGLSPKQFAKKFIEVGEFIFYTPDEKFPNIKPEIITTNSTNIGTSELLKMEVDFINDITSVSNALMGKAPASGTAASRYVMEMTNSTTSIASLFTKFTAFETKVARKKLKVIHQYWQTPVNITRQHSNYSTYAMYMPREVADIDFDVAIRQSPETPVARMAVNDLVQALWDRGAITAKQAIKHLGINGTDQLLLDIEQNEQAMQQGSAPQQVQNPVQADQQTVDQVNMALNS